MILATATVCTCQWTLRACKTWRALLLVQGFGVGIPLGVLYAVGTLCLGSHFKNNQPLSSMMSVSAGLAGAMVYTAVALACLGHSQGGLQTAYVFNAIISSCTLSVACVLFRRSNTYRILKSPRPPRGRRNPFSESGTILFFLGYLFLFAGLFIYPLYSVLLISSYPSHTFPTEPTKALLGTYGVAMLAAPFSANGYLRTTLGPVNSLIAATVVAAACLIAPAWIPYLGIALPFNIVYGVALGAVLSLHTKALSVFHWSRWSYHDDMAGRAGVVQAVAGLFVAAGVVWTAWVVDHTGMRGRWALRNCELGFGVAMSIGAVTMLVGAVFMALGRWRRCPRFFVVI
ncbi:hypothetical protein K505DRAFT_291517 [Melanomma pulvis-pyrius CBS 109.77]|uniref:MFS general substrate transporter n=1 Tax=Melanomma pulvis-pyrius CBS 109.77 TaxID=1314802 RepID=A0A6A6XYE4_9PLEO|nr:hypothetical protein K505DRAFT_291517 [Melanomma pulvis-pyrius CBS 109.77]